MADVLGLGLSHYPGFMYEDRDMAMRVKQTIKSSKVPAHLKDPRNWPESMQIEWGTDEGASFAAQHRKDFVDGVRKLRRALDDFKPDAVLIFGDDQYENFKEDIIPPFCIFIAEEFHSRPFQRGRGGVPQPNVWGEPSDKNFDLKGQPTIARHLARGLLEVGFDLPYAYKTLHREDLGHAFANTVVYLDYDRVGWPYPVIPFQVNAYGSNVIRNRGGSASLFREGEAEPDPPGPSPRRCFELGRAVARILSISPWRVAVVGSSSWSHAFLTAKNGYVYSDVASDRKRFEELKKGNYEAWRDLSVAEIEDAGEQELLNWIPLAGAMYELGQKPSYCQFIESYLMNSSKCVSLFPPKVGPISSAGSETDIGSGPPEEA